jgi:(1->4)-alpha-D-glucan 1-alpha-D-glucosylmutase
VLGHAILFFEQKQLMENVSLPAEKSERENDMLFSLHDRPMKIPASTYRVQLNSNFTFNDFRNILEYLHNLGIGTVYAAPVTASRPGSTHGYDVVDPHTIDFEIGTHEELKSLSVDLRHRGMYWLQDIVPNHMAFDVRNEKLMDVLERGPQSPFYNYFDIDWNHPSPDLKGRLAVPFLGKELENCVADGEVKIFFSQKGFSIDYFESSYPLSITAFGFMKSISEHLKSLFAQYVSNAMSINDLAAWQQYKRDWIDRTRSDEALLAEINEFCNEINNTSEALMAILQHQFYVLMYWRRSEREINYRRFFTVNELICLRMEDEKVFNDYHGFIYELYKENIIQGLRIDHIDGLHDPGQYLHRLRNLMGDGCYIIAEKILEAKETMPEHWPLQGTSGYEFLSYVNQLFTDRRGASRLVDFYKTLVPDKPGYKKMVVENKKLILENYMSGEWENLINYFYELGFGAQLNRERMKQALASFMVALPVYRLYPESLPLKEENLALINETCQSALSETPDYEIELSYLKKLFTDPVENSENALRFLKRLMQFTGPLTAKGVEDTTFYVYNPLISHDEVGDSPSVLGISVESFHEKMVKRMRMTPLSLSATSTHDTKRGEDSRMRLNILSEMTETWEQHVYEWVEMNGVHKTSTSNDFSPGINDEYFIYQSLVAGFPMDFKVTDEFIERVTTYLIKAVREAKVNSNWSQPDEAYEQGCMLFTQRILTSEAFLRSFIPFMQIVVKHANIYSLGQVLIKITAPGIPDIYQGCELWDLSFVDPDNRRPVDYSLRNNLLTSLIEFESTPDQVFQFMKTRKVEGAEKLFVTWKALKVRSAHKELFEQGAYIPLKADGKSSVVAFARFLAHQWVIVVVPLSLASVTEKPYTDEPDDRKSVKLPEDAPKHWRNLFSGEEIELTGKLPLFDAFKDFPVALLINIDK